MIHPSPFWSRHYRLAALLLICFGIALPELPAQQLVRVPTDQPNLASAVTAVSDGGVIEFAGGTYQAPAGGFSIYDLPTPKAFTIRAAPGAAVVFSGGGTTDIMRIAPSTLARARQITFEFITFANGLTRENFLGGGLTLVNAKVVFKFCTFHNNAARGSGTGGGAQWIHNSVISFDGCIWSDNSSPNFGGGMSVSGSRVFIRNSRFTANRVDVPNHRSNAAGGAIYIADATVRISNCAFDNNRAGYVGGAIDTNGSWRDPLSTPSVDVVVRDSSFTGNRAQFDPSVPLPLNTPAVGGAVHFEGQTTAKFYNCRFTNNTARQGGAVSNYLAITEFTGCVFKGNQATGTGAEGGQGGTIIALSSENPGVNHRPIQLTMTDCLIQGSGPGIKSASQGGCIFAGGDMNFAYGLNGSSQNGTVQSNRGVVTLNRVVLADATATGNGALPGTGGAILGTFVDLTMNDSIVENCEAHASGAGIQLVDNSVANITRTTIARCITPGQGTAITLFGSTLNLRDSSIINNRIEGSTDAGVAITSAPTPGYSGVPDFEVAGLIENCLFHGNVGATAIYDGDRTAAPFNRLQFSGNQFFPAATAYVSDVAGFKTAVELNALEISRSDGSVSIKSPSANTVAPSSAFAGAILMVPPAILSSGAPGEALPIPAYIAYAATEPPLLDGAAQTTDAAIVPVSSDSAHTSAVGSNTFTSVPPRAVAVNIATRLPVGTGQDVLIGGFIIQGSSPKRLVIRAVGPSLNGILSGLLQDPRLDLHDVTGAIVARNDNWRSTQVGGAIDSEQVIDLETTGVAPKSEAESAMVVTLDPGAYTAVIAGANNTSGIAIVEIYDLDAAYPSTLANISTRGFIQSGDNVMIGGVIFGGGAGSTQVVLRAIGPSLGGLGIANPLADPMLELRDANGAPVASNDDWKNSPEAATLQRLGFQPSNDAEPAIYQTGLARGAYTAVVRGKNGGIGVGVVEAYVF